MLSLLIGSGVRQAEAVESPMVRNRVRARRESWRIPTHVQRSDARFRSRSRCAQPQHTDRISSCRTKSTIGRVGYAIKFASHNVPCDSIADEVTMTDDVLDFVSKMHSPDLLAKRSLYDLTHAAGASDPVRQVRDAKCEDRPTHAALDDGGPHFLSTRGAAVTSTLAINVECGRHAWSATRTWSIKHARRSHAMSYTVARGKSIR